MDESGWSVRRRAGSVPRGLARTSTRAHHYQHPLTMADAASGSQDKSVQVKLVLLGAYLVWLARRDMPRIFPYISGREHFVLLVSTSVLYEVVECRWMTND